MSILSHSWKPFSAEQPGSSSEHGGHILLVITVNFYVTVSPAWLHMIECTNTISAHCACHVQDTAVFKYLKKLVSFHNQGDPRLLLRFINPAEVSLWYKTGVKFKSDVFLILQIVCMNALLQANILDAASGALIRFRLGGVSADVIHISTIRLFVLVNML